MANIASFEGYSSTLARLQTEKTALLSEGHDKRSNLEKSITLSLNSPRISSSPHAKKRISLLSLLPDGIRVEDIIAGNVPIPNVRQCQSVLIDLLEVWQANNQFTAGNLALELVTHLGNISQLVLQGLLTEEKSELIVMAHSIILLNAFSGTMLKGSSPLFQKLPHLIEVTGDAALRWRYAGIILANTGPHYRIDEPNRLIEDGIQYFNDKTRPAGEAASFYNSVARYYSIGRYRNLSKATKFSRQAFELAEQANAIGCQLEALATENEIAYSCRNAYWTLKVVHKARNIKGFLSLGPQEYLWIL
ncbi:hypothetical protein B0H14DRAFT_3718577 [Mycena olivaceomarginata]|nr:hypothetical protein B0H14DRAFT_3718577 [Mycena olivaceomarginata]